ncbi:MAG: hypothetical protein CM15mP88_3290 [Pseudomonadota bacterium]|nr:MAG: hypothetical protein CM15mP88_3290 [Pseudomonadota bacterium]
MDRIDPGVKIHFLPPVGSASVLGYIKEGFHESDLMYYLDAYHKNFFADKMLPYLRINGTEEYWRALDQNLSETMIGRMQPKEALDRTYKEWNEITERRGKAKQLKQYQEAVGYKN